MPSDIARFYRELNEQIMDQDGEITPDQEQALRSYEDDINKKVDALRQLMRRAKGKAQYYRDEMAAIEAVKNAHARRERHYRRLIQLEMEEAGVIEAGYLVPMKIYNNPSPSVDWEIGVPIPESLQRVKIELDKEAAVTAWKAGAHIDGLIVVKGKNVREKHRAGKGGVDDGD